MKNILYTHIIPSPIGEIFAACINGKLVILNFNDEKKVEKQIIKVKVHFKCTQIIKDKSKFENLEKQLEEYFLQKRTEFSIPYENIGTVFQKQVWEELTKIPYASTISYKQEANKLNKPRAFRAVANANAKNMIFIIIPCHRVISSSGKLSGFAGGGVKNKEFLLNLEKKMLY